MDYKKLIEQMKSLKKNSQMYITEDTDPIWQADVDALDEAMDIIADYEKVTGQLSAMLLKYQTEKDPIDRGMGVYQCPDCGAITKQGNAHCWTCGRMLGWGRGPGRTKQLRPGKGRSKGRQRDRR